VDLKEFSGKALELVQGEERRLRLRRRRARFGLATAVLGLLIQLISSAKLDNVGRFVDNLFHLRFRHLFTPQLTGVLVMLVGLATYALLRWTGFLSRESREAFRYTFQVAAFERVKETPGPRFTLANEDRFALLAHDLTEALSRRIGRFSLLALDDTKKNDGAPADGDDVAYAAHISIGGYYAIRQLSDRCWAIQVMPQVQIGSAQQPATLTRPVEYRLLKASTSGYELGTDDYQRIHERVYSSVATEVYRQLEGDVAAKMGLFPTSYLRAVALACEADDFARSNTVDAYDRAIGLYRKALRYFRVGRWPVTRMLARWPVLWHKEIRFIHTLARVTTGYARVLVYRFRLSGLSGLQDVPLYEIPTMLEDVVGSLRDLQRRFVRARAYSPRQATLGFLTFPEDSWSRRLRWCPRADLFAQQRRLLFDTHVVAALAWLYLGALTQAREWLKEARAVAPDLADGDALYCLTRAEIEPRSEEAIRLSQRAIVLEPTSEIANYLFAYKLEMRLRAREELTQERARPVIEAYDRVIAINPGNVAAITCKGYLGWLLDNDEEAQRAFEAGMELRELNQKTFLGESLYGLARLHAEAGRFNACHGRYVEAMREDPKIAAYTVAFDSQRLVTASYYYYIAPDILSRYRRYRDGVLEKLADHAWKDPDGPCTAATRNVVESFVQNDFGNACLNYCLRFGDWGVLGQALEAYRAATTAAPKSAIAFYNLAQAQFVARNVGWAVDLGQITRNLASAESEAPHGGFLLTAGARARLDLPEQDLGHDEKRAVVALLTQALQETRFARLLDGTMVDDDGGGVDSVIAAHMERDRIERPDLDTLILWARLLARNPKAFAAASRLCAFLKPFHPEDLQLLKTMAAVSDKEQSDCRKAESAAASKTWTQWFLDADPDNVTIKYWAEAQGIDTSGRAQAPGSAP
jgi:tetratricopeptide (TPR) repeat protein